MKRKNKNSKVRIRFIAYRKGVPHHHADVTYNLQYRVLGLFWRTFSMPYHLNRIPLNKRDKYELVRDLLLELKLDKDSTTIIEYPTIIYH